MTIFFAIAFTVVYAIHTYLVVRVLSYLGSVEFKAIYLLWIFLYCGLFFASRIFDDSIPLAFYRSLGNVFRVGLSIIFFAIPLIVAADLLVGLAWLLDKTNLWSAPMAGLMSTRTYLVAGFLLLLFGLIAVSHWNFFRYIEVARIEIPTPKINKAVSFLHITDLQFGTIGVSHVQKIAKKIQEVRKKDPLDFVINTGDQTDTARYSPEEIDLQLQDLPVFFSLGNHEFYHNLERTLGILEQQGYRILRNTNARFGELNIIGIDDSNDAEQVGKFLRPAGPSQSEGAENKAADKRKPETKKNLVDAKRFNILAYHRPRGVKAASMAGIDLMLCGHTHGGQVWPYTWFVDWTYDAPTGLTKVDELLVFVSSGMALWGPRMRLGSRNQIALIKLIPQPTRPISDRQRPLNQ